MNRLSLIIAVVCLCAGATAVLVTGRASVEGQPAKAARAVYEYKVFDATGIASKEKELNQLGADGWELVAAVPSVVTPNLTIRSSKVVFGANKDNLSSVEGTTNITKDPGYLLFRRQK
jgi:hypothetical protein